MLRCLIAALAMLIAVPAAAEMLIVGNKEADTVGFIDLAAGKMAVTRPTADGPHEAAVSPDGRRAAVVAYGSAENPGRSVSLFDAASAEPLQTIDLGEHTRPHGILWLPDGRHLVITSEGSGHLVIVDAAAGQVVHAIPTGQEVSHMVALSPDARRAYVANIRSNSFTVIDLEQRRREANVPADEGTEGIAVTPDGSEVWVSNRAADNVMVFDTQTFVRKAVIGTGEVPIRVAVSPDGRHAAVSNARADSLTVIDTASKAVVATVGLTPSGGGGGVPVTVLFHPDGGSLFVSLTNAGEIALVDTETWTQTGTITAGAGADGLGYSPVELTAGK